MSDAAPAEFVTLAEARYLTLVAQQLERPVDRGRALPTKSEILETIQQSGCVQLDSISVVSRAHETAIWSRLGSFRPADIASLHYPDAQLFEYWSHAASLLPIEFFPYVRRQMAAYRDPEGTWYGKWAAENRELLDHVMSTIRDAGPVSTRAFARPEGVERTPWAWYGGKPAKQALDCLWTMGDLVVLKRTGFERIYDLAERAFPELLSMPLPSLAEQNRFITNRALRAVGIGPVTWISDFYKSGSARYVSSSDAAQCLRELERDGLAISVELEGQKQPAWMDASLMPVLSDFREGRLRAKAKTLLSPFDNLLWRRERALALFGFDYRLESYTPEPKRIYGYYTLPILIDGRLVGRLDPRYRRKEKLLSIQSIHLEPGVRVGSGLVESILSTLKRFTMFLGGGDIEVRATSPDALLPLISRKIG